MATLNEDDRANLVAYLDGELDEEGTQAIEARLSTDPAARAELETLRQVYGLLDYLPRAEPSSSFTNRTMEKLSLTQRPRETGKMPTARPWRWVPAAGWAAAALLVFGLGWLGASLWWKAPAGGKGGAPSKSDPEDVLVKHLPLLERYRQYQNIDDVDFLRALDDPTLFGEDTGG
jgi:hypothetical protein